MEVNESYKTAYVTAYARLLEQSEPKETKLFDDCIVKSFFSNYLSSIMQVKIIRKLMIFMYNAASPGLFGLQACRTKYIDEKFKAAVDNGIEQVVILGAGLDTRLYRIQTAHKIKGFEVDLPIMQEKKKKLMKKALGQLPSNVTFTPIDFNVQTLDEVLRDLDYLKPTCFIWEGVTPYITKEAVRNTLEFISKFPSGSEVVFTYVLESAVDGSEDMIEAETLTTLLKAGGQVWCFGLNPSEVGSFIKPYNLELIEDVGTSYYQENYLKPLERKLDVSSIERIAYAKVP